MNTVDTREFFSQYPHLAQKISASWGYAECRELLVSLISDSRGGVRSGFSHDNAKTLFALLNRHDELYPELEKRADIWSLASADVDNVLHKPTPLSAPRKVAVRPPVRPVEERPGDWAVLKYVLSFFTLIAIVLMFRVFRSYF
jgi:hypothetical protein